MTALLVVTTTVASMDQARELARQLVERHVAACVQLSTVESFYAWDGAVQHEPEVRLTAKTTAARWPALCAVVRQLHPYQLPQLLAVPVAEADAAYAHWVAEHVGTLPEMDPCADA